MHILDLETALRELTRVLQPGGILVLGENNMHSLQSSTWRILRQFLGGKGSVNNTPAGVEYWLPTSAGTLLARETDMRWLIEQCNSNRLVVMKHVARQFTELYTKVSSPVLKHLIHGFNNFWFKHIKIPYLAYGNLIFFQKDA
jgi:ubiquinone/menaquinone biosynthesis C-methylase UbiE